MEHEQPKTPAAVTPDLGAEAKEFLQENFSAYRDNQHPQHARIAAEVTRRFAAAYPEPPKTSLGPELQAIADAPVAPPPSLGPNDRLARPPEGPDQYEITIPQAPQGSPGWDPDAWSHFRATAHQQQLSHHQVQNLTNFFATQVVSMLQHAGPDGLSPEQLGQCVARAKGIGLNAQQTSTMLDLLESQANPTETPGAKAEAERLIADPANGYFDRSHPRHAATRERVRQLYADTNR
jgi:hypothetical protein